MLASPCDNLSQVAPQVTVYNSPQHIIKEIRLKARRLILASALLALSATTAFAGDIEVKAPWVRGTVAGQTATGAFLEVTSQSGATLVGAASPVAGILLNGPNNGNHMAKLYLKLNRHYFFISK